MKSFLEAILGAVTTDRRQKKRPCQVVTHLERSKKLLIKRFPLYKNILPYMMVKLQPLFRPKKEKIPESGGRKNPALIR